MLKKEEHSDRIICNGESFVPYISKDRIVARIDELGKELSRDYQDKVPILVSVLNGAFIFTADLMRHMDIDCEIDFIKLSSYGEEKVSSGHVTELKQIDAKIRGRHVLIVEDIVDTGHSMRFILDRLSIYEPASMEVVTLLHKPAAQKIDVDLKYVGFEVDNLFVLGYGLDYAQKGRNIDSIYVLESSSTTLNASSED